MTISYREWFLIDRRTVWYNSVDNSQDTHAKWADSVLISGGKTYGQAGFSTGSVPPKYFGYYCRFKPKGGFDWDAVSLDNIVDYRVGINFSLISNSAGAATFYIFGGQESLPLTPLEFSFSAGTGRHYDGINDFSSYSSVVLADANWNNPITAIASLPLSRSQWGCAYRSGSGPICHTFRDAMKRNGLMVYVGNFNISSPFADGKSCLLGIDPVSIRLRYHNAVVNSLSRSRMAANGGVSLIITGLGFDNDDTELTNASGNPNSSTPPGGWGDAVSHIYFYGRGSAPTYTLTAAGGDFTVDSNTQITIASMPSMTAGAYDIYLKKGSVAIWNILGVYPGAYAGDWRAEDDGRLYRGERFLFMVGPFKKREIILTKWKFKNSLGSIFRYYSPIDIISPDVFYDGRILRSSALTRAISDKSGLFTGADMDFDLSNADKEFSILLAQYFLKNQIVQVYYGWEQAPEGWKVALANLVVDDYQIVGPEFSAKLRDISAKYFRKKVPLYVCTIEEYPNIHQNAIGKPMPEVLGLAVSTAADNSGAVEAVYVDITAYKYLAARGSLKEISTVYGDGQAFAPADYSISYEDGGRTYITFTGDQGNKKITFNCKGYIYEDWNSAAGYVQNPAYILSFFLAFLMEVPENFLNLGSFDDLAAKFDSLGFSTNGKLILQKDQDAEAALKELLFTFGVMSCFDKSGRFQVERKDISDILSATLTIFAQIDTLGHPIREFNTGVAFNSMRSRWDYIPTADYYLQSQVFDNPSSLEDYEQSLEPSSGADFPWTDSLALVEMRSAEELLKYGYGCPQYRFSVALNRIDDLDLFTNFKLQDPFAPDAGGGGDIGRYCYVESLTVDFDGRKIDVIAADMSYILRLYLVMGDEALLTDNWAATSEWMKLYGYLDDELTGRFANGDAGKMMID